MNFKRSAQPVSSNVSAVHDVLGAVRLAQLLLNINLAFLYNITPLLLSLRSNSIPQKM